MDSARQPLLIIERMSRVERESAVRDAAIEPPGR
jgi:hypothetical protein